MEVMSLTVGTELLPSNEKLISIKKMRLDKPTALIFKFQENLFNS
jgi:hypothetical protein